MAWVRITEAILLANFSRRRFCLAEPRFRIGKIVSSISMFLLPVLSEFIEIFFVKYHHAAVDYGVATVLKKELCK